jgi:rod shape determining protein RodA
MNSLISHLKRMDWILSVSVVGLVAIGLMAIYSNSLTEGDFWNFQKQIIFFGVGFLLMIVISFFDWQNFRNNPYLIIVFYMICLLSLAGIFFFAPEIRGTKSWYKIGPFSMDPIEFTKVVLIILFAKYFSMRHIEMYRLQHIFLSGVYVFLPAILVFLQPNFGSVIILIALWLGALIISGIKIKHFIILMLIFLVVFAISWGTILKDYQKARIVSFFMPQESDRLEIGWNQTQSEIAIGSGRIFGQGFGKGSQTQYGFLPEAHTDFIFATIAEEFGLVGVFILLALYSIVIWRIMRLTITARSNFIRLFGAGIVVLLISQIFIHLGMNLGILPIIGIALPLVSYGGSGLIALFILFGIFQSIKISE